jgi:hypothetical protein
MGLGALITKFHKNCFRHQKLIGGYTDGKVIS